MIIYIPYVRFKQLRDHWLTAEIKAFTYLSKLQRFQSRVHTNNELSFHEVLLIICFQEIEICLSLILTGKKKNFDQLSFE